MTTLKNRFTSINSAQRSKLKRHLDRLHRQTARDMKMRIKMARNELASCDNTRILSHAKNALVAYSTAIISGATRGTESVSITDKALAKQKIVCSQSEKKGRASTFKKEEAEFCNFISGLLRRVDKCCESHRKAEAQDADVLEVLCGTK